MTCHYPSNQTHQDPAGGTSSTLKMVDIICHERDISCHIRSCKKDQSSDDIGRFCDRDIDLPQSHCSWSVCGQELEQGPWLLYKITSFWSKYSNSNKVYWVLVRDVRMAQYLQLNRYNMIDPYSRPQFSIHTDPEFNTGLSGDRCKKKCQSFQNWLIIWRVTALIARNHELPFLQIQNTRLLLSTIECMNDSSNWDGFKGCSDSRMKKSVSPAWDWEWFKMS
jgi:hypothetical protein